MNDCRLTKQFFLLKQLFSDIHPLLLFNLSIQYLHVLYLYDRLLHL
jgi:hypothetical protein